MLRKRVKKGASKNTAKQSYTDRLIGLEPVWKKVLDVQMPYRMHLRWLKLGFVLDIGCGIGRNLINLGGSAAGVGIDHNQHSIAVATKRGLTAFTPKDFEGSEYARKARFDTILLSHVAEHMKREDVINLLHKYLAYLHPGGRIVFITPQERGFSSDPTHVMFMDFEAVAAIAKAAGLKVGRQYSFPFPRIIGHIFKYNEFVTILRNKP